jgi:hypothetical protein
MYLALNRRRLHPGRSQDKARPHWGRVPRPPDRVSSGTAPTSCSRHRFRARYVPGLITKGEIGTIPAMNTVS